VLCVPFRIAVKACVWPASKLTAEGFTLIGVDAMMVTVAAAVTDVFAWAIAVTVTVAGFGTVLGAT
jgi:hypothetical protein